MHITKEVEMLKVADDAKKYLKKALHAYTDDPEIGLRLLVGAPGKIRLRLDKERSGDQVVEYEGFKVLLVGQETAEEFMEQKRQYLAGSCI